MVPAGGQYVLPVCEDCECCAGGVAMGELKTKLALISTGLDGLQKGKQTCMIIAASKQAYGKSADL